MESPDNYRPKKTTPKKQSGALLYVILVSMAIVAACGVSLALGKNPLKAFSDTKELNTEQTLKPQDEAPATKKSEPLVTKSTPEVNYEPLKQENLDAEPLEMVEVKTPDIKVTGDHGDADKPKAEQGILPENQQQGLEVEGEAASSHNSVTLRGDTLEAIENSRADSNESDRPRRHEESLKPHTSSAIKVLERGDNPLALNKKASATKDRAETQIQPQIELGKIYRLDDPIFNTYYKDTRVEYNGKAIPGGSDELLKLNPKHYTLQIAAGPNKQILIAKSAYLKGRYWIYKSRRFGKIWYALCVGDYLSKNEAQAQVKTLPKALRVDGPFAKSFGTIQQEMRVNQI